MTDLNEINWSWIDNQQDLEAALAQWMQCDVIGIDTEFMRTNTYYAKPGLLQFATADAVWLVDPLAVDDLGALAPLLAAPGITKVMHAMSEDIELLHHECGHVVPSTVFDTQVAAAFAGMGPALGYQALVQAQLGEELDKAETRSDWLQRPLSDTQIDYAIKDTHFLIELYTGLAQRLREVGLYESVIDEGRMLIAQSMAGWELSSQAYLRVRGGWDLSQPKQQLLQALVCWRDAQAREKNLPRSWVFSDAQLLQVAQHETRNPHALWKLDRVKPKSVKRFGDDLCQLVREFEPAEGDFEMIPKPLKGREMELYKRLKNLVAKIAAKQGIAAQILGSRKMLERIVINVLRYERDQLPEEFAGWRRAVVGQSLLDAAVAWRDDGAS